MRMLWRYSLPAILLTVCAAGCTTEQYVQQADRAAYGTIAGGQKIVLGETEDFHVDYDPFSAVSGRSIRVGEKAIPLTAGEEAAVLTLGDCMQIAFRNSRSFQTRRENLYAEALTLASESRTWNWSLIDGPITGSAEHRYTRLDDGDTNSGGLDAGLTLTQRFFHGGVLALGASLDVATDFVGWGSTSIESLLDAQFTQPLLQGAWRGLAYEEQYRRERDFLFSVFRYDRFTQTFVADIHRRYYNVLQQRDELENEKQNIERLKRTLVWTRVQAEEGQVSRIQQDQAEANLLDAQVRLARNEQNYRDAVDSFKLALGMPIQAQVRLDYPASLEQLQKAGPRPVPFTEAQAVRVALTVRPDVLTERAKVRDAGRDVEIAADGFLPQLDLVVGANASGKEPRRFAQMQFGRHTRFARLELDYNLDQTENRDAYRRALIAQQKAGREYDRLIDEVRLGVRQSYRTLQRSRRSYEIQVRNVKIAARRSKLASLQQQAGHASARDVLEAEEALRNAQNGLTSALVDYTTTRLQFLAELGMLAVDEQGQFRERPEPFTFERIEKRYPYVPGAEKTPVGDEAARSK